MALRGHVFTKQLFSSECFALFIDTFLNKNNGIVKGCSISNTANSISIEEGYFCIKGRFLQEEGGTTFPIESSMQNDLFCRLICEIDLSQENTTADLKQAQYKIIESTQDYPILRQEDITIEGSIYQFEFAKFKVTENGIEDFEDKRTFLDFNSIYSEIRRDINSFIKNLDTSSKEEIDKLIADLKKYCDAAKEILEGDVAMNIINQINALKEQIETNKNNIQTNSTDITNLKKDAPFRETFTLLSTGWKLNQEKYEYRIDDANITEDHFPDVLFDGSEQEKIVDCFPYTYNGYMIIQTSEQPTENIKVTVVFIKTVDKGGA